MATRRYLTQEELALTPRQLSEKFGIAYPWKVKRQGWFCPDWNQKKVEKANSWNADQVVDAARTGVFGYLKKGYRNLKPYDADDLVAEAVVKLIELSGRPQFSRRGYRVAIAWNAARKFVRNNIYKHRRRTNGNSQSE